MTMKTEWTNAVAVLMVKDRNQDVWERADDPIQCKIRFSFDPVLSENETSSVQFNLDRTIKFTSKIPLVGPGEVRFYVDGSFICRHRGGDYGKGPLIIAREDTVTVEGSPFVVSESA